MNVQDFIKEAIGNNVLEVSKEMYLEILEDIKTEDITDEYWIAFRNFYDTIKTEDKLLIFKIIRQVQIDALSSLFSTLDGISNLDSNTDDYDFKLLLGDKNFSGYLQETLLSMDDDSLI